MDTREDLIDFIEMKLNDIKSEIDCREGRLFEGDLCDALAYLEDVKYALKDLDEDNYSDVEDYEEE